MYTVQYCNGHCTVRYCTVQYCNVLVLNSTVRQCTCTLLFCTVLHCTCTALYCTVQCSTVRYSSVQYCYTAMNHYQTHKVINVKSLSNSYSPWCQPLLPCIACIAWCQPHTHRQPPAKSRQRDRQTDKHIYYMDT